jgi:2-isopropylmalate synthase
MQNSESIDPTEGDGYPTESNVHANDERGDTRNDPFSAKALLDAEAEYAALCAEFDDDRHAASLKRLESRIPKIVQNVVDRLNTEKAAAIRARRSNSPQPPDATVAGEIEDGCLEEANRVTATLVKMAACDRNRVRVLDCTLREGVAPLGGALSSHEKIWLARQIVSLGVDIIEVGFAWDKKDLRLISHVARDAARVREDDRDNACSLTVSGLARCARDWQETRFAVDALRDAFERAGVFRHKSTPARTPAEGREVIPRLHLFIETSEALRKKTSQIQDPDDVVALVVRSLRYAKEVGFDDIQFSAMDATRSDFDLLRRVFQAAIKRGATTVNLTDTAGWATPQSIGLLIHRLREVLPEVENGEVVLGLHAHNTLGMATANCLAACAAGVRHVEVTVNGLGPRGGNAPLEEVATALAVRGDLLGLRTGIETKLLVPTSQIIAIKTGLPVPASKPIVGRFAAEEVFCVELPDVRSDDVRVFAPEFVGATGRWTFGPKFSKKVLEKWLRDLKLAVPPPKEFDDLYNRVKHLASVSPEISPEDLIALVASPEPPAESLPWSLIGVAATTAGVNSAPVASVRLKRQRDGREIEEPATGVGTIAAVFTAINRATGVRVRVRDYQTRTVAETILSQTEATVVLENELDDGERRRSYPGNAVAQDIIMASAQAYLNAVNLICLEQYKSFSRPQSSAPLSAGPPRVPDTQEFPRLIVSIDSQRRRELA